MKLYRVIPDYQGVFYGGKYLCSDVISTESILYYLGYINNSQHAHYFEITTDSFLQSREKNDLYDNKENGLFFFTSIKDCLYCMRAINHSDFFAATSVRILEYNVPDEILSESYSDYGMYFGKEIKEYKIPIRLLQGTNESFDKLSPELEDDFVKVANKMDTLTYKKLIDVYKDEKDYLTDVVNSDDDMNWVYEVRLEHIGIFFKSNYITGNVYHITELELLKMCEDSNKTSKEYENRLELISKLLKKEDLNSKKIYELKNIIN